MARGRDTHSHARIVDLDVARRERTPQPSEAQRVSGSRRQTVGRALAIAGGLAGVGFGFSALLVDLTIVYRELGSEALALSLVVAPLTFLSVPWYALFNQSDMLPILLGYAAPLGGWLLTAFGRSLEATERDGSRPATGDHRRAAANVIPFPAGSAPRRARARVRAARRLGAELAKHRETF